MCLVTFNVDSDDGSDIGALRIGPDGRRLDASVLFIAGARLVGESAVAWNGKEFLVVWTDSRGGLAAPDIYGARVTEEGDVKEPEGFATSGGEYLDEYRPAVAYGADRFLVPYAAFPDTEEPFTPHFILGKRVKHDTRVLDTPALVFTRSSSAPPPSAIVAPRRERPW